MCGLTGWVDQPSVVQHGIVAAMTAALSHRGPDDTGTWRDPAGCASLGHRRLSIIDLSREAAQPIANETSDAFMVFNGEIYNHAALREELEQRGHRFRSHADSEVILHGWEEWGIDGIVSRLRGMFAFAIWSARDRVLVAARDRIGIKPFYLANLPGGGLIFASEVKALLCHPAIGRRIDSEGLRAFLSYGYVPAETTMFAGVRKLRAGHILEWRAGHASERSYWELQYRPGAEPAAIDEAAEELRGILSEAVRIRLQADVPVGSFLSGGVDSSTVTTLAASQYGKPLDTFCVAFPEMDDQDIVYARLVASALGTRHHELSLRGDEARDLVLRMPAVLDEPLYDPSVLPTYLVARLARRHVSVALSGTGGDEVFAGYGWLKSQLRYAERREQLGPLAGPLGALFSRIVPLLRALPPGNRLPGMAKVLGATQPERSFYLRGFFDAWEQRRLLAAEDLRPPSADSHLWLFQRSWNPDWPLLPALLAHDLHALVTDNELALLDRTTMAHGLEARVPMLDHILVERVFTLPWEYMFANGEGKRLLRLAVAPILPPEVLSRRKYGFSPPFKAWLHAGPLADLARNLGRGRLVQDGVISGAGLRRTLARGALRRTNKLWMLVILEAWYRHWICNAPAVAEGTPLGDL